MFKLLKFMDFFINYLKKFTTLKKLSKIAISDKKTQKSLIK